jgi:hypothetical protein
VCKRRAAIKRGRWRRRGGGGGTGGLAVATAGGGSRPPRRSRFFFSLSRARPPRALSLLSRSLARTEKHALSDALSLTPPAAGAAFPLLHPSLPRGREKLPVSRREECALGRPLSLRPLPIPSLRPRSPFSARQLEGKTLNCSRVGSARIQREALGLAGARFRRGSVVTTA